jgi:hypothetical protein
LGRGEWLVRESLLVRALSVCAQGIAAVRRVVVVSGVARHVEQRAHTETDARADADADAEANTDAADAKTDATPDASPYTITYACAHSETHATPDAEADAIADASQEEQEEEETSLVLGAASSKAGFSRLLFAATVTPMCARSFGHLV